MNVCQIHVALTQDADWLTINQLVSVYQITKEILQDNLAKHQTTPVIHIHADQTLNVQFYQTGSPNAPVYKVSWKVLTQYEAV